MDLEIMRDPRVRSVQWRDLTRLNKLEVVSELIMPAPWLLASLYAARQGWYPVALGLSFVFFLTGLRVVHGAYHYTLGLTRAGCEWVMFVLSIFMLGSMHAVQINHLQHHKHCMDDEDVEAMSARMSAWKAILVGPAFPVLLHANEVPGEQPIPPEGAIDEAVETAKRFCGAEAPGFVNGILAAVLRERQSSNGGDAGSG